MVVLRILIGLFFVIIGGGKLIEPYQNFLYVVQGYELFPETLAPVEDVVARVVPWVELLAGVFLILGLWLKKTLKVFLGLITGFLLVIGQALVRKLPLEECGCFGDLISISPREMLLVDGGLLILVAVMLWRIKKTSRLSLDSYF